MKKKISLILAITMLLSGCNTAEKAEQKTAEITTTTAETTVATTTTTTTTTTTIATTTEKQTSSTSKETEITQATEDTPMTPKSEVYLFDYHSFDEIAPSEEEQFEIFENVFYGEWESDLGDISFTYQDCYFSFTNSCDPTCLMEIDEGYVLPYIAGGVVCCFFVNKNDLSVMYNAEYDFSIGGITIREYAEGLHKSSHSYSKEISEGKLSSLGQMKLNSIAGGNFEECLNGTLDEKPIFTDIDGTEWVYGLGTLGTPDQERYLVSYSEDKVELGIRHFKKSEYDAYMDMELDVEPEEQYFVLVFEKTDGVWQYKNTYEPVEEVYFADSKKDYMGLTSWKNSPNGKILETDVVIAKNYLSKEELESLELIVSAFLDLAENRAKRHIPMTMEDWSTRIDKFLLADDLDVLKDAGKISHEIACDKALTEFEKYRIKQDKLYKSDFDLLLEECVNKKGDNDES